MRPPWPPRTRSHITNRRHSETRWGPFWPVKTRGEVYNQRKWGLTAAPVARERGDRLRCGGRHWATPGKDAPVS